MRRTAFILASVLFLFVLPVAAQQKDNPACKDSPLFSRMPGYWIYNCTQKQFDAYAFPVGPGKTTSVEGQFFKITYYPQNTLTSKPSELQIQRNFENAVKQLGGTVVSSAKSRETFRVTKDGKELWIELWTELTGKHGLTIVEKGLMTQDITANADALMSDLRATGHASVQGIYFDTGKSEIKPESEQAISEIAKLLKNDAALKVFVVGHTDNIGNLEANMKLSQDRAEAVVQALVRSYGTAPTRLKSFGNGPCAPVASNDTEEGKARNRRVELVKQ